MPDTSDIPFREVPYLPQKLNVDRRPDGTIYLDNGQPLKACPSHMLAPLGKLWDGLMARVSGQPDESVASGAATARAAGRSAARLPAEAALLPSASAFRRLSSFVNSRSLFCSEQVVGRRRAASPLQARGLRTCEKEPPSSLSSCEQVAARRARRLDVLLRGRVHQDEGPGPRGRGVPADQQRAPIRRPGRGGRAAQGTPQHALEPRALLGKDNDDEVHARMAEALAELARGHGAYTHRLQY